MAMEPPLTVARRIVDATVVDPTGKEAALAAWTLAITEIQTMVKTGLVSVMTSCGAGAGTGVGTVT